MILALFIALAIAVFAVITGIDQRGEQARVLRARLAAVERASERNPRSQEIALLRDELLSTVPALNRLLTRSRKVAQLQRYLAQAEVGMRAGKFLLLCACLAAVAGLIVLQAGGPRLFALLAAVAGGSLCFIWAAVLRLRRFRKFEALFPEAIDLLGRAIRAGHSFSTSLELIANELAEPLAGEFRKIYDEQKFGLPTREALLNLADRVPLFDVKFFVMAVLLQRETGGNLAEILDKLSYLIRERFKILRQVRVYTAQGRLSMIILMSLPFIMAVALTLISPQLMAVLYHDPTGQKLIFVGLLMLTAGFLLIRRIIHIRV